MNATIEGDIDVARWLIHNGFSGLNSLLILVLFWFIRRSFKDWDQLQKRVNKLWDWRQRMLGRLGDHGEEDSHEEED